MWPKRKEIEVHVSSLEISLSQFGHERRNEIVDDVGFGVGDFDAKNRHKELSIQRKYCQL